MAVTNSSYVTIDGFRFTNTVNSNHNTIDENDFGPEKDPGTFLDIAGSDTQSQQIVC